MVDVVAIPPETIVMVFPPMAVVVVVCCWSCCRFCCMAILCCFSCCSICALRAEALAALPTMVVVEVAPPVVLAADDVVEGVDVVLEDPVELWLSLS